MKTTTKEVTKENYYEWLEGWRNGKGPSAVAGDAFRTAKVARSFCVNTPPSWGDLGWIMAISRT